MEEIRKFLSEPEEHQDEFWESDALIESKAVFSENERADLLHERAVFGISKMFHLQKGQEVA